MQAADSRKTVDDLKGEIQNKFTDFWRSANEAEKRK